MPHALNVRIGETRLALLLSGDQSAAEPGPLTALPHGRPLLLGLITVQGRALPLLDISSLLPGAQVNGVNGVNGDSAPITPPLLILTELDGERVALGVDEVLGVSLIGAPPPSSSLLTALEGTHLLNLPVLASELRASLTQT